MAGQNVYVDIDDKLLEKLKQADEALKAMVVSVNQTTESFRKLTDEGLTRFARAVDNLVPKTAQLNSGKVGDLGTAKAAETITKSANDIHNAFTIIEDSKKTAATTAMPNGGIGIDVKKAEKEVEKLGKTVERLKTVKKNAANALKIKLGHDAPKSVIRDAEIRLAEKTKELSIARRALSRAQKELDKARNNSQGGVNVLDMARTANTLAELKRAYKGLKQARENVNPNTTEGRKQLEQLNKALIDTKKKIDAIEGSTKKAKDAFGSAMKDAGSMGSMIKSAFNLYAIRSFTNQLITVHGEFELIRKSLAALLNSTAKAELLWTRITNLALKSPFQVKQLATATKQMAAYRIESEKLYTKTKMLADISAGLGVEISRLILAYGQVKAANFLRGTELRQFSEAGVDMLAQLSTYYSELEGRIVSVDEVFKRISERQVLFEDVDAVLTRITSRGGAFYEMQEKQANTLRGKISNLKDEIDLMFNEIGEKGHGLIVSLVGATRWLVENWRLWLPVLSAVVSGWVTFKTIMLTSKVAIAGWNNILNVSALVLTKLGVQAGWASKRVNDLNLSMSGTPWGLILSVIGAVGMAVFAFSQTVSSANDEVKNNSIAAVFYESSDAITSLSDNIISYTRRINSLSVSEEKVAENSKEIAILSDARAAALAELTTVNQEYAAELANVIEKEAELRDLRDGKVVESAMKADVARNLPDPNTLKNLLDNISAAYDSITAEYERETPGIVSKHMKELGLVSIEEIAKESQKLKQNLVDYAIKPRSLLGMREIRDEIEQLAATWSQAITMGDSYTYLIENLTGAVERYRANANMPAKGETWSEENRVKAQKFFNEILSYYEELDNAQKDLVKDFLGDLLGFKWEKLNAPLKDWQGRYNSYIQSGLSLMGSTIEEATKLSFAFRSITSEATKSTDVIENLENQLKESKKVIEAWESYSPDEKSGDPKMYYTEADYNNAVKTKEIAEMYLEFFGILEKAKDKGKDKVFSDALRGIKDVHDAYRDLRKTLSDTTSVEGAWTKFGDMMASILSQLGITVEEFRAQFGDLASEESFISALEWLETKAKTPEDLIDVKRMKGEYTMELYLDADKQAFDELTNSVEEMFAGYELSIELEKLHLPKNFAEDFFDIDIMSIEDLRKKMNELKPQFEGTDELDKYNEFLRKIDEMEAKSQQGRLKKYIEFARKSIGERAKIMLDGVYELQDIEKAFTLTDSLALNKGLISEETKSLLESAGYSIRDLLGLSDEDLMGKWLLTDEQVSNLRAFVSMLKEQQAIAVEGQRQKTKTALDKEEWDAFRATDTFAMMMSDLDTMSEAAISRMIEQLEKYKEQWHDMPVSDMKQLIDTIEKLKDVQAGFESPRALRRDLRGYLTNGVTTENEVTGESRTYKFGSVSEAQTALVDSEAQIMALEQELSLMQQIEQLRAEGRSNEEIITSLMQQGVHSQNSISKAVELTSDAQGDAMKAQRATIGDVKAYQKAAKTVVGTVSDIDAAYKQQAKRIQNAQKLTGSLFDAWDAINGLFEEDSMSSALADMGRMVLDGVLNMIMLQSETFLATLEAEGLGAALNAAMGPIGWIVLAIQVLTKILTVALQQHDKNLQKQIEAQQEKIDALKVAYEELERQMEDAYNALDMGRITQDMKKNLEAQIKLTESMIALEEDKKKSDDDAIAGMKEDLVDLRNQIEELTEDTFSNLTAGILDDVRDVARNFVDAWADAFEETGNGIKGLEDSFAEAMKNLVRQQASLTIMGPYIDRMKEMLQQFVNEEDPVLDANEANALKQTFDSQKNEIDKQLEDYYEMFDWLFQTSGELSDLEKGIQGITEDQAEVLAAYWNSCRFMISNIDKTLTTMANAMLSDSTSSNPILSELKAQTALINSINNMFGSVIGVGNGSSHAGAYLKVHM